VIAAATAATAQAFAGVQSTPGIHPAKRTAFNAYDTHFPEAHAMLKAQTAEPRSAGASSERRDWRTGQNSEEPTRKTMKAPAKRTSDGAKDPSVSPNAIRSKAAVVTRRRDMGSHQRPRNRAPMT
jgi:hypothetical protein